MGGSQYESGFKAGYEHALQKAAAICDRKAIQCCQDIVFQYAVLIRKLAGTPAQGQSICAHGSTDPLLCHACRGGPVNQGNCVHGYPLGGQFCTECRKPLTNEEEHA